MMKRSAFALALALALVALALPAAAHTGLESSSPAPGEQFTPATLPDEIRITFEDPVQPGSTFKLYGEGFSEVPGVAGEIDPEAPDQLVAPMPPLDPGEYSVQWTAISPDGDEISGSFRFSVQPSLLPSVWWFGAAILLGGICGAIVRRLRRRAG
jgi:methionine-rich copper-binding protein CopC